MAKEANLKQRLLQLQLLHIREQLQTLTRDPRAPCRPHLLRQGLLTRAEIDHPIAAGSLVRAGSKTTEANG